MFSDRRPFYNIENLYKIVEKTKKKKRTWGYLPVKDLPKFKINKKQDFGTDNFIQM